VTQLPRIAGLAVGAVGIGTVAGRFALEASARDDAPNGLLVTGAGVGIGALGLVGGTMLGRVSEQALSPGLARSGRTVAALGAALVAGSLIGEVASRFVGIADGRRAAGDVRDERAKQQSRIDAPQDATRQATTDAERYEHLAKEFQPLPADAAARPHVDDGRLDIAGSPIASAARAIHQMYDRNDDDLIGLDEQQRPIPGGVASIASLMAPVMSAKSAQAARDKTDVTATVADLEQVIADRVDTGGVEGVIDNAEATAWFAADGTGEKALTWDGAASFLADIAAPAYKDAQNTTYAPGPWRDHGDDIMYLPGVETVASAKSLLAGLSTDGHAAAVLVALPAGAPSRYGVVSLHINGAAEGRPYDDTIKALKLDSAVLAVRGRGDVYDV
jgi:hypothetical protein